jgi:hypothetical protein
MLCVNAPRLRSRLRRDIRVVTETVRRGVPRLLCVVSRSGLMLWSKRRAEAARAPHHHRPPAKILIVVRLREHRRLTLHTLTRQTLKELPFRTRLRCDAAAHGCGKKGGDRRSK